MKIKSTPIKPTPILYGKDAERFLKQLKENENKKLSEEEIAEMKKNYELFLKISKSVIEGRKE